MAFVQNFTAAQANGVKSVIILTDTSTGSDIAITDRRVYLIKDDTSYLVPSGTSTNYIEWALSNISINIDALTSDFALNIRVDWLDINSNTLYTKTLSTVFLPYLKAFLYLLSQKQFSTNILLDSNYVSNKAILWELLKDATNSIIYAADIVTSQNCIDRATYMQTYQSKYF